MNEKSRLELYREFTDFVHHNAGGERRMVNRRIFSVFLWCFLIPASISGVLLVLVKAGFLPRTVSRYMDWLILVFPILYSFYVLSSEVLSEMPIVLRQGSLKNTTNQAMKDTEWRARICQELTQRVGKDPGVWKWIVANFRVDLETLRHRAKYLTVLAGAVFFLLMQGIDSLGEHDDDHVYQTLQGWIESSSNSLAQFVGLGLFLVLLYLSGSQNYTSLKRYLICAELIVLENSGEDPHKSEDLI